MCFHYRFHYVSRKKEARGLHAAKTEKETCREVERIGSQVHSFIIYVYRILFASHKNKIYDRLQDGNKFLTVRSRY